MTVASQVAIKNGRQDNRRQRHLAVADGDHHGRMRVPSNPMRFRVMRRRKEEGGRRKEEEEGDSWDQSIKWHVTQVTTGRAVIRVEEDGLPEDRRCCFRVGSVVAMARCTSIETFLSAD